MMMLMLLQGDFAMFYNQATDPANSKKLFVMIVDECHYGATLQQAHDTYVNDCNWLDAEGRPQHGPQRDRAICRHAGQAKLLQQTNLLTLLVSATPWTMLTDSSRIPDTLFVPAHLDPCQAALAQQHGLKPLDVLSKPADAFSKPKTSWHLNPSYPSSEAAIVPKLDVKQVSDLVAQQVSGQLHVCSQHMIAEPD